MFDVTQPAKQADDQAEPAQAGAPPIGGNLLQRLADDEEGQRIYLPRGSPQSRCEPPTYN
jgi:hypothetical protein